MCTHTHTHTHTHTGILLSHKKDEILPFATTWMDFEGIMLNEISQTEKYKIPYDFTHMWNIKKNKQTETNEQTKPNKNKHLDTDNTIVVIREEGAEGRERR